MSGKITTRHSNGGTEAPVSQEEASSHIEKVLGSAVFRGSETSRQLLLFLAKSTAEDPSRRPKEHEIATAVLGRGVEFDPRVDSVVRVQIGRLRSKLAEYYISEGSQDEVVLHKEAGGRLPVRHSLGVPAATRQLISPMHFCESFPTSSPCGPIWRWQPAG